MSIAIPSVAPSSVTQATIDPRCARRAHLPVDGEIITEGGTFACAMRDVSLLGISFTTDAPVFAGMSAILRCDTLDALITIVRCDDGLVGACFDAEEWNSDVSIDDDVDDLDVERMINNRRFFRLVSRALDD